MVAAAALLLLLLLLAGRHRTGQDRHGLTNDVELFLPDKTFVRLTVLVGHRRKCNRDIYGSRLFHSSQYYVTLRMLLRKKVRQSRTGVTGVQLQHTHTHARTLYTRKGKPRA